ncbi:hypothetical protein [Brachybacterium kimchii]|uniref:Uncharacterized protein n=1 Tax=Brachybacterium kimchii TaxID=2942909 RepID=A0ABY4NAF7_9MICO|nr:hypothetical protein [Brachybacterium kimchii]UQN31521.1 hypothetical protein M4486_09705 [Brachybacterium kimchii]
MIVVACGALLALSGVSAAYAGTSYSSCNTTVGKFNGSGYTGYQTKSKSSTAGSLASSSVGGNYKVDARMKAASGTGGWVRDVTDSETRNLPNGVGAGKQARVQFSNDALTRVDVQVTGKWKSN